MTMWFGDVMVFATALAVSAVATPLVRAGALRWRIGAKPNGRGHESIPHLGGVALFLAVSAGFALALYRGVLDAVTAVMVARAAPAILLILVLGLVDDTRSLAARRKLAFQAVAASALVAVGFRLFTGMAAFDTLTITLAAVSFCFLVGMLSSVNLVDGHDGLAAGVALISGAAFAAIGAVVGQGEVLVLALAVCGACAGFLFYNFPPGRIYMGDTGSMFLGLALAVTACLLTMRVPSVNTFAAVCFVLGVPLLDTLLAVARRVVLRSPLFGADNLHMHHVLRDAGLSPRRTLAVLYAMQGFFSLLGIGAAVGWVLPVVVGLGFVTVVFTSFLRMMVETHASPARQPAPSAIPFKSSFSANLSERRTSVGP